MINFLVPSDCSDTALSAMRTAIKLGRRMQCKVYFMNVVSDLVLPAMASRELRNELYEEHKIKHQEELETQVRLLYADLKVRAVEAPYECIIAPAPLDLAIVDYSSKLKIDLIIMGTSGASGFRKIISGSNTSGVVKKSKAPVLVIPSGFKFLGIKKIALTLDINEFEHRKSFEILNLILKFYNADLDCFYILPKDDRYSEAEYKFEKVISDLSILKKSVGIHIKESEPIAETLEEWLKEHQCDIVAMMPRDWTLGKALFSDSMTEDMIHRANLPLLVLP